MKTFDNMRRKSATVTIPREFVRKHLGAMYNPLETFPNGHKDAEDTTGEVKDIGTAGYLICDHPDCVESKKLLTIYFLKT